MNTTIYHADKTLTSIQPGAHWGPVYEELSKLSVSLCIKIPANCYYLQDHMNLYSAVFWNRVAMHVICPLACYANNTKLLLPARTVRRVENESPLGSGEYNNRPVMSNFCQGLPENCWGCFRLANVFVTYPGFPLPSIACRRTMVVTTSLLLSLATYYNCVGVPAVCKPYAYRGMVCTIC